jgi:hypothetical protein
MVGSSGDSGRDRTGTCSGADANGRTVPHMACRLEKPIFDCFPRTGRGVGLLTKGEVERTMGIEPAFSAWEMPRRPVVAPHPSEVSDCPVTACNRCSGNVRGTAPPVVTQRYFTIKLDPTGGDLGGVRPVHLGSEPPLAERASLPIVSAL